MSESDPAIGDMAMVSLKDYRSLEAHLAAVVEAAQEMLLADGALNIWCMATHGHIPLGWARYTEALKRLSKALSSPPIAAILARQKAEQWVIEAALTERKLEEGSVINADGWSKYREAMIARKHAVDALVDLEYSHEHTHRPPLRSMWL